MSQRIAIVGGGIAGLTAAWYLSRDHQVTLFEAEPRLGGHTFTVDVQREHGDYAVDMGFIVFNDRTYPRFEALLAELLLAGLGEEEARLSLRQAQGGGAAAELEEEMEARILRGGPSRTLAHCASALRPTGCQGSC